MLGVRLGVTEALWVWLEDGSWLFVWDCERDSDCDGVADTLAV